MKKTTLFITLGMFSALLTACGGGSGGGNTPSTSGGVSKSSITGQVIDGYLVGATVFLDKNLNSKLDDGEPTTQTTAGGKYTLALTEVERTNYPLVALINDNTQDTGNDENATTGEAANANGNYILSTPPGKRIITPFTTPIMGTLKKNGRLPNLDLNDENNAAIISRLVTQASESIETKIPDNIKKAKNKKFPLFEDFLKSDDVDKTKTQALAEKMTTMMAKVTADAIKKEDKIQVAGDAETATFNAVISNNMLDALANENVLKSSIAASENVTAMAKIISNESGKTVNISENPETNTEIIAAKNLANAFSVYTTNKIYIFDVSTNNSIISSKEATMKFTLCPEENSFDENNYTKEVLLGCYDSKGTLIKSNKEDNNRKEGILDEKGRSIYYSDVDTQVHIEKKGDNIVVAVSAPIENSNEKVTIQHHELGITKKDYSNQPVKKLLQDALIADATGEGHFRENRLLAGIKKQIAKLPNDTLPDNSLAYSPSTVIMKQETYEIDGSVKKGSPKKNESTLFVTLDELNGNEFHLGGNYAEIDTSNKKIIWHQIDYGTNSSPITKKIEVSYTEKLRGDTKVIVFKEKEMKYQYFIAEGSFENKPRLIYGVYDPAGDITSEVSEDLSFNKTAYDAIDKLLKKAGTTGEIDLLKKFVY